MDLENKYCSSYYGAPNFIDKEIIENQKYLYIVFLRIGDAVVISLTKNHDSRIEQLIKNNEEFSVLFSATVSNPLETRRLFWKELKQYMIGNKKEHRYYVQDDVLISIINKNNKDLHYPCLGEYVGSVSLKKEK